MCGKWHVFAAFWQSVVSSHAYPSMITRTVACGVVQRREHVSIPRPGVSSPIEEERGDLRVSIEACLRIPDDMMARQDTRAEQALTKSSWPAPQK